MDDGTDSVLSGDINKRNQLLLCPLCQLATSSCRPVNSRSTCQRCLTAAFYHFTALDMGLVVAMGVRGGKEGGM